MLKEFLQRNEAAILALTEKKTLELAGDHPSSEQLKQGLPGFYRQIIEIIGSAYAPSAPPPKDVTAIARAADRGDEPAMADAAGHPLEAELARSAGRHGLEMLRLGYTLSHVVHAYGAMCQAITQITAEEEASINATEFHALNRCLDVAIAGAVTAFQARRDQGASGPGQAGQELAHEMRSTIASAKAAFEAIQGGAVGPNGTTAVSLARSLLRLEKLIERSLVTVDAARPNQRSS
jgi:hypothetical protein